MKSRLDKIKEANEVLNYNNPALKEELDWVIEQANKFQKIECAWKDNPNNKSIQFLRTCKEIIDGVEIPKRKAIP